MRKDDTAGRLYTALVQGGIWLTLFALVPASAQTPAPSSPTPTPKVTATPKADATPKVVPNAAGPKVDLPPLKLPDIPGEDPDEPRSKDVKPAAPLPPLPIPPGPAVIDSKLPQRVPYLFRIEYDGRLVGYSGFQVSGVMSLAGQSSFIIDSRSRLKLGVGGPDDSTFVSKLIVDTKTLAPSLYKCSQSSKGSEFTVQCLYTDSMVAQTNIAGKGRKQDHFHTYKGETPRLLFNNLWGHWDTFPEHYWLLVRSATKGASVSAYDPILRGGGHLVVYAPKAEKWKWEGETLDTLVYPISDMEGTLLARVRVQAKTLDLLEVQEIGRGVSMKRTRSNNLLAEVEKVKSLDLLPRRVISSNVIFNEPEKLTDIEAEIDMSLRGGQFADHRVPGYRQYFTGELKEGEMKGRVVVRSVPRDVQYTTKYPYRKDDKPPAEMDIYLHPGPGVESEYPPLLNKAVELAWKAENTFQAARKMLNFVGQIEEGVSLPSARYALESGVANPESKALLLVAMARACGFPARRVGGLLFRDNSFVPHHWTEIWLGRAEGWAPFDPTTLEAGRVGATHIALWESGDLQRLDLKIVGYSPRAPKKVSFFNRELAWSVGEERVYDILREGQKVGEERAGVRELVVREGEDLYRFEAATSMEKDGKTINYQSELWIDPKGLPASFSFKDAQNTVKYSFKDDTAHMESETADGKKRVREIPFSNGTYFTDRRFLSQWALVVGQTQDSLATKALKVGDKVSFHAFIPDTQKSQELFLEVKEATTLKDPKGQDVEVLKLEADSGMTFYLNKKNQVMKIAVPQQKLELVLRETHSKMP